MIFNNDTRTRILVPTMVTSFDPTTATLEVKIDSTWYAGEWTGAAVATGGAWTRAGRTVGYFAGPAVTVPAGATVLALGRHPTETRVVNGGDIIVAASTPIDVQ